MGKIKTGKNDSKLQKLSGIPKMKAIASCFILFPFILSLRLSVKFWEYHHIAYKKKDYIETVRSSASKDN